ncbi:MAG: thermonuclease family protein [Nitrospiraceae bacterium]
MPIARRPVFILCLTMTIFVIPPQAVGQVFAEPQSSLSTYSLPSSPGIKLHRYPHSKGTHLLHKKPTWKKNRPRRGSRWLLPRYAAGNLTRQPQVLDGWQVHVIDGDTIRYGTERIRVRGFDAPELSASGGFEATQRLDQLLHEGQIRIVPHGHDTYGRIVADVYVNDRDVAEVLTNEGYAKPRS